jgi:putative sterol carrier protein
VPDVGSDGWITAFAARVADADVPGDVRIVVQQELTDSGACWHVVLDGPRASVVAGPHAAPDVTFTQDTATAAAIESGALSAQQAFMDGRLRVRGAVGRLVEASGALAALGA